MLNYLNVTNLGKDVYTTYGTLYTLKDGEKPLRDALLRRDYYQELENYANENGDVFEKQDWINFEKDERFEHIFQPDCHVVLKADVEFERAIVKTDWEIGNMTFKWLHREISMSNKTGMKYSSRLIPEIMLSYKGKFVEICDPWKHFVHEVLSIQVPEGFQVIFK